MPSPNLTSVDALTSSPAAEPPPKAAVNPATGWGTNVMILFGLTVALYYGQLLFIPFVIALLLACVLWPAVGWLARGGLPWALSATAVVLLVLLLLGSTIYALSLTVPRLLNSIPTEPEQVQTVYSGFRERIVKMAPWAGDLVPETAEESGVIKYVREVIDPKNPQFVGNTWRGVGTVGYWLLQTVLIVFQLFFFLLEGRLLTHRLVDAISPDGDMRANAVTALQDIAFQVRSYLLWRTVINVAMAVVMGITFQLCGLSQPWTWALLTAVLLYVPFLGATVAGVPPILDAFLSVDSPWVAVGVLVFYVVMVTIEGYYLVPVIMGKNMDLNASTVLLTTVYWELVWGPAGLFLSMPLMAMVRAACAHVPGWQAWGRLMETEHPQAPQELPKVG